MSYGGNKKTSVDGCMSTCNAQNFIANKSKIFNLQPKSMNPKMLNIVAELTGTFADHWQNFINFTHCR